MELAAKLVFFCISIKKAAEEVSFKIPRIKLIQFSARMWKSQERKSPVYSAVPKLWAVDLLSAI